MSDPFTDTQAVDEQLRAPEELDEVEQGARMDPHGLEPEDDPLPEGVEVEE